MKFTHFSFENFKGIGKQKVDLTKNGNTNIFALVGLNESGKTTILEAMNFFSIKQESLDVLELDSYKIDDIHNLIPINKRDNFNDKIVIEAGVELEPEEIQEISRLVKKEYDIKLEKCSVAFTYSQKYEFKNSIYQEDKGGHYWTFWAEGKKKRAKKVRKLTNEENQILDKYIRTRIPSILYFPNFLFEFPEKIYLNPDGTSPKNLFYQKIIQDVLDSLKNKTNVEEHLIARIGSEKRTEKRNLNSLIGKMEKQLTKVIFNSWNEIFRKKISEKEIVLYTDVDDKGAYVEFNIKDDVDTYSISERSLGFRWFFVYILLTQFRNYRKQNYDVFFLFDEPASNLHPSAQSELLKSFENLPNVLYTTHSHYLINPKWLESTFVVKNKGIDYENEADYNARNTDISIMKYREFVSRYPSETSYFQPILEILEYKPANLELVPKVVLTEGKFDFYTYNYYQEVIKAYKNPVKFVPGTSVNNLTNLISLYLGWGASFLILLDSDTAGIEAKDKYIEMFGESLRGIVFTYKDIDESWINFESEKLFLEKDKLGIQRVNYPKEIKYNKKIFNRSVQENYVTSESIRLSKETHSNFKKVFDFLKGKLK